MQTFEGGIEAATAVGRVMMAGNTGLPDSIVERLNVHVGVPGGAVPLIVGFAEAVYANATLASDAAKSVAAGCALHCEQWQLHGLGEGSRGSKIAKILDGGKVPNPPTAKAEWADPVQQPAQATSAPAAAEA
ncbi:MAG: hypothetical protein K2X76_15360 [Sphingomonas sp.]|nr:hypothetical protein [Sphingomonas sp.]